MLFSITKRWVSKTSKRHHNLFKNKKKKEEKQKKQIQNREERLKLILFNTKELRREVY